MAERTLNDPLSGAEIKAIIMNEVEKRLNGDCYLTNDSAWGGFSAFFEIKIKLRGAPHRETLVWGTPSASIAEAPVDVVAESEIKGDYEATNPDKERQAHNLPTPVLIQTPAGPKRQRVTIDRVKDRRA